MLFQKDRQLLKEKGITEDKFREELNCFTQGFPFLELNSAASTKKGIKVISPADENRFIELWDNYRLKDRKIIKFVPASGAASRMFKDLFLFLDAPYEIPTSIFEKTFFNNLPNFAFYKDLDNACLKNEGKNINTLVDRGQYKCIINNLLNSQGLNYGNLPKGLLKFHHYQTGSVTPIHEHLTEGYLYAKNNNNEINIHFTVSPGYKESFEETAECSKRHLAEEFSAAYNLTFSEQKSYTDTIAVDSDNNPLRDETGNLLFRPGGHGALIENLNELNADIIFIKNIDNIVQNSYKATESRYKKLLAGILIDMQNQIFEYLNLIELGNYTRNDLNEILNYIQERLNIEKTGINLLTDNELRDYLYEKLNRPCRVCGMVKNIGEPGGGPFLAYNADKTVSPQILESSQIDMSNQRMKEMFEKGTHFNPVDLVCGVRDFKGNKFDLKKYIDNNTGFISIKTKDGKALKALELPGLWNGAMSDWNTIFVEVPIETFNPVKTVNDLLRKSHMPEVKSI